MKRFFFLIVAFSLVLTGACQSTGQVSTTGTKRSDHDWYSETTGIPPRSIEDSIFTYGDVGINTPTPNDALDVKGSAQIVDSVVGIINGKVDYRLFESNENLFIKAEGFAPSRSLRIVSPGTYDIDVYNDDNVGNYLYKAGATYSAGLFGGRPNILQEVQRTGGETSLLALNDTISLGHTGTGLFTGIRVKPNAIDYIEVFADSILLDDFPNTRRDPITPLNFFCSDQYGWLHSVSIDSISGGSGGASALNDLTDVNTAGLTTGDVLTYTGSGWGPIAPLDDDPNNEIQSLSLSGSNLSISGGNSVTLPSGGATNLVDLADVDIEDPQEVHYVTWDGQFWVTEPLPDDNQFNELQTLSISGNTLSISNRNSVTLPSNTYNARSGIAIDGSNNIIAFDNSPNNEIQTLSLSGNDLTISGSNTVTLPGSSGNQTAVLDITPATLTNNLLTTLDITANYSVIAGSLINTTNDYFTLPAGTYEVVFNITFGQWLRGSQQYLQVDCSNNQIGAIREYRLPGSQWSVPPSFSFKTLVRNTTASMDVYFKALTSGNNTVANGQIIITKLD
jgi:hypothetical protein